MNTVSEEHSGGWEKVIRAFLKDKRDVEEEYYLKAVLKEIASSFERQRWLSDEKIKAFFDPKKNKKDSNHSALSFLREKFQACKELLVPSVGQDWDGLNSSYEDKCRSLDEKYSPVRWIADNAPNAGSVSFATHVTKLTHSKIDSPSILDQVDETKSYALTTSSLSEKVIDGAVAGNQFAPIFQFLELQYEGVKLAGELAREDSSALSPFAGDDDNLLTEWNAEFRRSSVADSMASHALLKQVYFPVSDAEGETYHLLCSVTSSSLAQTFVDKLFSDQQAQASKAADKGKYSGDLKAFYFQRAQVAVTASNHSNASQLNGKRGGKLHLLSAQPPLWKRQSKPPITRKSWFDYGIPYSAVSEDIQYLREFLIRFERLELSTRDPKRRKWLVDWGNRLVDEVLFQAEAIQVLPPGWSNVPDSRLKLEHQCFLDPYRSDEEFQAQRAATDWQTVVCKDFAHWLNKQLKGKDNAFTPQPWHTKLWIALMETQLRELDQTLNTELASRENNA